MSNNKWSFLLIPILAFSFATHSEAASAKKPLRFQSYTALKKLLAKKTAKTNRLCPQCRSDILVADGNFVTATTTAMDTAGSGAKSEVSYSETNVQVAGVDEGDNVKTDGSFIYQLYDGKVRLVQAYPAANLAQTSELSFDDGFYPTELYVAGERLVVIGNTWQAWSNPIGGGDAGVSRFAYWWPGGTEKATAKIYNTSDKTKPVLEREVELDGSLLSSRKIGDNLYLLSRTYPRYYYFMPMIDVAVDTQTKPLTKQKEAQALQTPDNLMPHISDTAVKEGKERTLPLNSIYYFPDFVEPNYVTVASLQLSKPEQAADVQAFYGSGDIVYASKNNLYLSAADYTPPADQKEGSSSNPFTHIYKFALNNGSTQFLKQGEVPGTVLNQFSMDEHGDYFRIATTVNNWSWDGQNSTSAMWNNLYTLDGGMNVVGKLENLAPGERIYSTRFVGDRCYLVTFKQVDPLFVIDLATPTAPKVLGELKIPGFSTYLHPFDENHIIGFGRDTVDVGEFARVDGMKLAMFDVSDVANPKQKHSVVIGTRGSYSELLYDHKALWFDKQRGLMGFPVQVTKKPEKSDQEWWGGEPEFEGAYVYAVSAENGFQQKAAITHQPAEQPSNYQWWDYSSMIHRLLTIDDQLYTVSDARIQVNDLINFKETAAVQLAKPYAWYLDAVGQPVDDAVTTTTAEPAKQ